MQQNSAALPPLPSLGLEKKGFSPCRTGLDARVSMNAILAFCRWKEGGVVIADLLRCPLQEAKARGIFSARRWHGRKTVARCPRTPSSHCRRPPSRHQWSPRPTHQCHPTSLAVRGLWREAWNSAHFTCCTDHPSCASTARSVGVCPGGVVCTGVS